MVTCGAGSRAAPILAPMSIETISFARGAPSADILPAEAVRDAAARALKSDWQRALSYGTGKGHPGLCEWVAELHGVDTDRVMMVNGSMEGASLLFGHFISSGDRVVVEQPTYDRTLLLLKQSGAELAPVPLEADGVDVEAIERACTTGPMKLAHVIPNFHNPAGCTLSAEKRERLVALAAEHGFVLFEDDPYRLISFAGSAGKTMLEMDDADRVIHASSFSKTVSPGVRVGYLVGPAEAIAALAKTASENYISPNMLAESIVWELCRSGALEQNITAVNRALGGRRDAVVQALREKIPEARFVIPEGGYFLWLDLADDVDTGSLLREAKQEGVTFVAGPDFMIAGGRSSLRLSFAPVPTDQIAVGVDRLARALERLRAGARA
ncbi:PLP-dependent aminotransferase family protein [Actinopolymorpha sp. B9G3]|uniref:aminotransferase-like domain-containing protein n=1 Tax=Actinopolymorpha sp. B9G3 TaxID=3158970 RepID=UPI0032D93935